MGKKYTARRDMPIFVGEIEVVRKFILLERAKEDELFLRRLASQHRGSKVFYAMDCVDSTYDLVEIMRSRRHSGQTIPAAILARLLGFAPMEFDLPDLLTLEEAQARLDLVDDSAQTLFQKKTAEQLVEESKSERSKIARIVEEGHLESLRRWLAATYTYIPVTRN